LDEEKAEEGACSPTLKDFSSDFLQNVPNPDFSHVGLPSIFLTSIL